MIVARLPVQPGNSDICFEWKGPIADAITHLTRQGVAIELGPVKRNGAKGEGTSVYFRDPDGSLLKLYPTHEMQSLRGASLYVVETTAVRLARAVRRPGFSGSSINRVRQSIDDEGAIAHKHQTVLFLVERYRRL